jgi:hypothetical protein
MSKIIDKITYTGIDYPVYQGSHGKYYIIDNIKYDVHFPIEWATDHKSLTGGRYDTEIEDSRSGPKDCLNCKEFGKINGVFAFYCTNCINYVYKGTRGKYSEDAYYGDTITDTEIHREFYYLRDVSINQIGDVN